MIQPDIKLILTTGLPCTGKTTISLAIRRQYNIRYYGINWIKDYLHESPVVDYDWNNLRLVGYEFLTLIIDKELSLGNSIIVDSILARTYFRDRWLGLTKKYNSEIKIIECFCSDEKYHKMKLKMRNNPDKGGGEGKWSHVEKVKERYNSWKQPKISIDLVDDFGSNLDRVIKFIEK